MRVFKTRGFQRWAHSEGLIDSVLCDAVAEIEQGLVEATLGSGLFKKRVPLPGRGKRGGARTLLAFRHEDRAAFLFGFRKNDMENIGADELVVLRGIAKGFLAYTEPELERALKKQAFYEVDCHGR